MIPPVFATLNASSAVKALIGSNPVRAYQFGRAPQPGSSGYAVPYVTWQLIGGTPENYLAQAPDIDSLTVQVDCWGESADSARTVADAVRNALQAVAYIVSWQGESKDPDTQKYRYSFDVDFYTSR